MTKNQGLSPVVMLHGLAMTASIVALILLGPVFPAWGSDQKPKEVVVLVHGILNKSFVLDRMATALRNNNYEVINWGYPSKAYVIEEHAKHLDERLKTLEGKPKIHFVGFSQGAIIIRYLLTHYRVPNAGRFVMVAPPNHGSEIAEDFYQYAWFRGLYGDKSIKQLFAKQNEFLTNCGIPKLEFGIIAGGKNDGKGFSDRIPGDDDGTVSVASTHLEGSRDFVLLEHTHTPLVWSSDTIEQAVYFLQHGAFMR